MLYQIVMTFCGHVDWVLLFCNYLGLMLMGGLFIAVGLFFSACTKHQVVAALCSMALLAFMTFAFQGLSRAVDGWPKTLLLHLSVRSHFDDFVRGLLDVNHVIFFVTTMALFLFLAVKTVEFRRWR